MQHVERDGRDAWQHIANRRNVISGAVRMIETIFKKNNVHSSERSSVPARGRCW
jgi:hypothetical protein